MADGKIKVLVAEDSRVVSMLLVHLLESDPRISVIGTVGNGQAAIEFVSRNRPDVVLMDIHMPRVDGFEATRRIMQTTPVPIVICSATFDARDVMIAFRALEAGAIACVEKPVALDHAGGAAAAAELVQTVKLMSEVKVVRRVLRAQSPLIAEGQAMETRNRSADVRIVGIGASTGGPPVLQTILSGLTRSFPVPVLIVQHIAHGFLAGMAEWLTSTTGLPIHIAAHGIEPLAGHVYLAPDDFHMGVGPGGTMILSRDEPESHLRPAVSFLFRSLARVHGAHAVGVLLTGMGRDGAAELKSMKDVGAITIAQDRGSSAVHGMPGVAIALGGATHVLPCDKIAAALLNLAEHGRIGSADQSVDTNNSS